MSFFQQETTGYITILRNGSFSRDRLRAKTGFELNNKVADLRIHDTIIELEVYRNFLYNIIF